MSEYNAALAAEREQWQLATEECHRIISRKNEQLAAAVEALKKMPQVAYESIIEGAGVTVENLPNELQCIADAALARIGVNG